MSTPTPLPPIVVPKAGRYFHHARMVDPRDGGAPQPFVVTKVARGIAYFRAVYTDPVTGRETRGPLYCCPVARFGHYVKGDYPWTPRP